MSIKRSPILGYNHNVRYAGRLWHIQTEDSGVGNPRIFTHLFHEGTILATKRSDYDATLEVAAVQKLMQEQHKQLLRELKAGAFDDKIGRFFGTAVQKEGAEPVPAEVPPPDLPPPTPPATVVDIGRSETLLAEAQSLLRPAEPLPGPMTDPSMPAVSLPIAEPADFDNEDSLEITVEPGTFALPSAAPAPAPAPAASAPAAAAPPPATTTPAGAHPPSPSAHPAGGSVPIPPVPSVPRQPSLRDIPMPRQPSLSNVPRVTAPSPVPARQAPVGGPAGRPPSGPTAPVRPSSSPSHSAQSASPISGTSLPRTTPPGSSPTSGTSLPRTTPPGTSPTSGTSLPRTTPPGRQPSQIGQRPLDTRGSGPVRTPTGTAKPPQAADDPLSQIPIFAAPGTATPQAPPSTPPPATQPRRDATPLRVPTRGPEPATGQRARTPTEPNIPKRQSSSVGVVKPTSEGVVVARPAVVIGGSAPPAAASRTSNPRSGTGSSNRWHQVGGEAAPPPAGAQPPRGKTFGSDLISERSLDEVILAYLSEDAKDK